MDDLERRTIAKLSWRLLPFLVICYFAAYLDRVNVSFAALTMNHATAYGLGAGIFFFSYFVFEVPSNLALERFGARRWIALWRARYCRRRCGRRFEIRSSATTFPRATCTI